MSTVMPANVSLSGNAGEMTPAMPAAAMRSGPHRFAAIAAGFAIALTILSLGITGPFEKDAESQSAQWVVDIAQHGHWLLPHDYYDLVERN